MPFAAKVGFFTVSGEEPAGYPTWPTMPTWTEWQAEAEKFDIAGAVSYDMIGTVGTATNGNQYSVSLPGGNVFIGPRGNPAYIWDYSAGTFNSVTLTGYTPGATPSHLGPSLSTYNGNIYIPPFGSAQTVIEYDPTTGNSSSISDTNLSTGGYYGSCPLVDGRIIFKPRNSTNHRVWDPATNTSASTTIANGSGFRHPNMVQHPKDGMVYMMPYRDVIKKWDPTTDTYSTITLAAGSSSQPTSDAYQDATIGADGKIYGSPWNSGDIGIFDIDTSFFQRYDPSSAISTGERPGKGHMGNDGRIYFPPYVSDNLIAIPTASADSDYGFSGNTCTSNVFITNISGTIGSATTWDLGTDGNANLIGSCITTSSGSVLRVTPNAANTIVYDFQLSPHTNVS